jgi:hypothetical protein
VVLRWQWLLPLLMYMIQNFWTRQLRLLLLSVPNQQSAILSTYVWIKHTIIQLGNKLSVNMVIKDTSAALVKRIYQRRKKVSVTALGSRKNAGKA